MSDWKSYVCILFIRKTLLKINKSNWRRRKKKQVEAFEVLDPEKNQKLKSLKDFFEKKLEMIKLKWNRWN